MEELKAHFNNTAQLRIPVDELVYKKLQTSGSHAIQFVKEVPSSHVTLLFGFLLMDHTRINGSTVFASCSYSIMKFLATALDAFRELG